MKPREMPDGWMDDPAAKARFEKALAELDEKLRPVTDAMEESTRLTEADYRIIINAR